MAPYYLRYLVRNGPKTTKNVESGGRPNVFFCFCDHQLRNTCCEIFVSTLTVSVIQKSICKKFHKIRCGVAFKYRGANPKRSSKIPQNTS